MRQQLHTDLVTTYPGTEYFVLGSGKMIATIQWSKGGEQTPFGLLLSDPDHFSRKWSTHLFHPEYGLERTEINVYINSVRYRPQADSLTVRWDLTGELPVVIAEWQAGKHTVTETFSTRQEEALLQRAVVVRGEENATIRIEAALYASPAIYSWFTVDSNSLLATGYETLRLSVTHDAVASNAIAQERLLWVEGKDLTNTCAADFLYTIGNTEPVSEITTTPAREHSINFWESVTRVQFPPADQLAAWRINDLFRIAAAGLNAAVSTSGRFDASLYQYNFEWSGDASIVSEALVYSGQFERARAVLVNILTRLSNDKGMVAESSRFRGGKDAELNNNGEVLKALRTYVQWSGDLTIIEEYCDRIIQIGNFITRPEYLDAQTGLLRASRDIWERMEAMGIRPGYDMSHQTFGILGLQAGAEILRSIGEETIAEEWSTISQRMKESFLHHPTHSFVKNGRFIKRRLLDGSVQYEVKIDNAESNAEYFRKFMPAGMPLATEGHAIWEPDVSECFPICYGLVDPSSSLASQTMEMLEMLWSQDWTGGGYGRYNVLSEPDSPGPWSFATCFMAAAYVEIGDHHHAYRAIKWLVDRAGAAGSWFEFYGERPTPPLPPTGIIVWGWAQFITLVVRHILGAKVQGDTLVLEPKIQGVTTSIRFRDTIVHT